MIFTVLAGKVEALTQAEQEAEWQAELQQTEADIAKWQSILDSTKANTKSLKGEAAILTAKINQAKAFIKQKNIEIAKLEKDIEAKNEHIQTLQEKINTGHDSLAQLLRKTNEIDNFTLPEVVLSRTNLSDFFSDVQTFQSVNRSLDDLFIQIRGLQSQTEQEKAALDKQKDKETDTKVAAQHEQAQIQADETQKEYLIKVSQTNEKTYAQVVADKQAQAAKIRAALFALRDTASISFGDALKYAQEASAKTGVRPAFLLAIITQESNLGQNVGSCFVTNSDTGDGVGKNTGTIFQQVMKAPRDTVPFLSITNRLGRDWKSTPVSCPLGVNYSASRGYGGGMGPSQFIPSTWELFKDEVGGMLGIAADSADPWNPEHSFMATAIYMQQLGAVSGSYSAERNAACKYYSGSACSSTRRPPNISYGNSVMSIAEKIQTTMIDPLQNL